MRDVNRLLKTHQAEKERPHFSDNFEKAGIYFKVRNDWSLTQKELAAKHGVSQSGIGLWRKGEGTTTSE